MDGIICAEFKNSAEDLYLEVRKAKVLHAPDTNVGITDPEEFARTKNFRICGPPAAMKDFKNAIYKHVQTRSNLSGRLGFVIKKIKDKIADVQQKKLM
jgi:hypothetical protein